MADEPLTKEQLEICRRDFDALAPDGTMGKREVSKLLSRQLEREPTPLELDAVLNEMARLSEHHGSVYTAGTAFTFETYVNCLFGHAMEAGSDPAYSKRIAGPIFQEYLQLLNVEENIQGGLMELSSTDCLLVIDMQNDFLSAMPDNPIEAPPFAATESEHVVEPICELMKTFHNVGGLVIATKDYHPWDHCSFMGRGDDYPQQPNYPPHCVQGSQGSKLYSPICATLCELMRSDASRAKIAWKGFHEKVDSFGGKCCCSVIRVLIRVPCCLTTPTIQMLHPVSITIYISSLPISLERHRVSHSPQAPCILRTPKATVASMLRMASLPVKCHAGLVLLCSNPQ